MPNDRQTARRSRRLRVRDARTLTPGPGTGDSQPAPTDPLPAPGPAAAFAALDRDVPVLMLPVRLETRFVTSFAQPAPHARGARSTTPELEPRDRELRVRIYPDQIHLDDHDPVLTAAEQAVGHAYWTAWHAANGQGDVAAQAAARDWLVSRAPARRAAWIARRTTPTTGPGGNLVFPKMALGAGGRQPVPAALPDRWAVIGYVRDANGELAHRFTAWTAPVAADLALGLDPTVPEAWSTAPGALPVDPRMEWMIDYDTAVAKGMAVTVTPARLGVLPPEGLALVLAVGVSSRTPAAGAAALTSLLEAHAYSDGLAFVPQGTPTNNTDLVTSPWSFREPDPAALLARELDGADAASVATASGPRLAAALGLGPATALARAEHAGLDEEAPAAAMNRALWPVTWGQYFETLLASTTGVTAVPRAAITSLEGRFYDHVRGGAPLPAIRTGAQPYGVLPVRLAEQPADPTTAVQWTEDTLLFLRDAWVASLPSVARMDPVLGASGGAATNDPESRLVEILAALPHPRRFALRWLRDWREESYDDGWAVFLVIFGLVFLGADDPLYGYDALSVLGRWGWARHMLTSTDFVGVRANLVAPVDAATLAGADAQLAALRALRTAVGAEPVDVVEARMWIDYMIGQVELHRGRQAPLDVLDHAPLAFSGVLAESVKDPRIMYGLYGDGDPAIWYRPLVERDGATLGSTAHDYLAVLANRVPHVVASPDTIPAGAPRGRRVVGTPGGPGGPRGPIGTPGGPVLTAEFHANKPLLYQLLDTVVDGIAPIKGDRYRAALATLGALPAVELELRFRETLGLATHRLDAWFTSLARERLDAMRAARANGVQLGGFGWVTDLVPDAAGASASQGFVHAPSVPQATTAAILRAGWSAHGTAEAASTLAVDLRGKRIADASWLLDGIRCGQALGDLLGSRFERRLHDRALDAWIDPVRRAVLVAAGDTSTPRGPVDGLALRELDTAGGLTTLLAGAGADAAGLRAALADMHAAIDAVGDAGIAESVHQVAQGNTTRAAATLDAISLGEVPPPELDHASTAPRGPAITHRLVVLLGGGGGDRGGWSTSPRAALEPGLESWAASLLGGAAHAVASVTIGDGAARQVSMAALGVSALDVVAEAPLGELEDTSAWAARLRAWAFDQDAAAAAAGAPVAIDFAAPPTGTGEISFAELAQVARAVRAVLGRGRALDARDLAAPDTAAEAARDVVDLEARASGLVAGFRSSAGTLAALLPVPTPEVAQPVGERALIEVRTAMRALAGYELAGAIPSTGWREADRAALYAEAWALSTAATGRLGEVDTAIAAATLADTSAAPGEQTRIDRAIASVTTLIGRGAPLLARVRPVGAALSTALANSDALTSGDRSAPAAWLQSVAAVRAGVARFDDATALADWLGRVPSPLLVAQLPSRVGEPWLARNPPADRTSARIHLAVAEHGGVAALASGAAVSGILVEEWVERLPTATRSTGLAFHFDAPAARAPQSLLLMVPPQGEGWDLDLVAATLCATFEDARLRTIGPESLAAYGHHLPAIFAPGALDPGDPPTEEAL